LTLTIPISHGRYLIAALSLLVSWAGISAWTVCSYIHHQSRAIKSGKDVLDTQLQVLLRESGGPPGAILDTLKLQHAYRTRAKRVYRRTLPIVLNALTIWLIFASAGILIAQVASSSYGDVTALAKPGNCGFLNWDVNPSQSNKLSVFESKQLNDTLEAEIYANSFYPGGTSSIYVRSVFPSVTLPFIVDTGVTVHGIKPV